MAGYFPCPILYQLFPKSALFAEVGSGLTEYLLLRRLTLLKYLHAINLSPEETLALMRRLETDSCCPEDYEVLIRIVRAHTNLSADFMEASPVVEPSSPAPKATRTSQGAKRPRR